MLNELFRVIGPYDDAVWNNKGVSLHALARDKEAIQCYDRALRICPDYADAWGNKGVSLHALARDKEAVQCRDKADSIREREEFFS